MADLHAAHNLGEGHAIVTRVRVYKLYREWWKFGVNYYPNASYLAPTGWRPRRALWIRIGRYAVRFLGA